MLTDVCQRWRDRRSVYRTAGGTINTLDYEVAAIPDDTTARAFVEANHYSGSYPAARFRYGLYRGTALVGVSVFSHPPSDKVLTSVFPGEALASVELGRLVLLDDVPANGETWMVARCFELLRKEGLRGVVSFSDPVPRTALDGRAIFAGHIGTIYQAGNAVYLGRATPRTIRLLPDGTVFSARAAQKIRQRDKGWRYSSELLVAAGAASLDEKGDARAWLATWLPRVTRTLRHGGNHKYAWGLERASRKGLPASLPYPKFALPQGQLFAA